jgi:anti-sigma regulatory factor (Ser/Thr protein kinase)
VWFFIMKTFYTKKNIQQEIRLWATETFPSIPNQENIIILLSEVIQNIYRHAYEKLDNQKIEVAWTADQKHIEFIIHDDAISQNLDFLKEEFEPTEDGKMGLRIIKKIAKQFSIQHKPQGHETRVTVNIN